MSKKTSGPRKPSVQERALWKHMTRDVQPLHDDQLDNVDFDCVRKSAENFADDSNDLVENSFVQVPSKTSDDMASPKSRDIDSRTFTRLRKGQIRPEARLDLHGYSKEKAYDALRRFVISSRQQGFRCVLVITGKGKVALNGDDYSLPGVLKRSLPDWLGSSAFSDHVLQWALAQPKDGGGGAYYIYLRKKRA